jgi:hypothetical protein
LTAEATWLLFGLLAGHFLGDFTPLATARMQEAKASGGPLGPILTHASVHAGIVVAVLALLASPPVAILAGAAAIELTTHFLLDAARAKLAAFIPAVGDANHKAFWSLLGFDQLLHALVLVAIASWAL